MTTTTEIADHAMAWLDKKIAFRQFEDWFVSVAGQISASNDHQAEALVDEIDLYLSEYSDGVLTADQLRNELSVAIRPFVVPGQVSSHTLHFAFGRQIVTVGSSSPSPWVAQLDFGDSKEIGPLRLGSVISTSSAGQLCAA